MLKYGRNFFEGTKTVFEMWVSNVPAVSLLLDVCSLLVVLFLFFISLYLCSRYSFIFLSLANFFHELLILEPHLCSFRCLQICYQVYLNHYESLNYAVCLLALNEGLISSEAEADKPFAIQLILPQKIHRQSALTVFC